MNEQPTNRSQMDKLVRLSDVTGLLRKSEKLYHETYVSNVRADVVAHCIDLIKTIPAVDAVEVVRCGECKYSDTFPEVADSSMPLKCLNIRYGGVYPDWYCEHGQRREDGDNGT